MQKPDEEKRENLLVLCIDRDDDIGRKIGVRTPILGEEANKKSAVQLILADPEEADANAMFEGLRIYSSLRKDKTTLNQYQIATIAGSELGGVAADRKIVSEFSKVLEKFQADGLILVTDGFADEDIIPLIQSRVPVTSVRRVVMKHSESIEETAAVFSRYLRLLTKDPRYSKIALGLPGLLLVALGILSVLAMFIQFELYVWTGIVALLIMGSFLLGKGFGLDKRISALLSRVYRTPVSGVVTGFSFATGLLLIGIGFYQAGSYISSEYGASIQFPIETGKLLELLPQIVGWLISKSLNMVVVGICIIFLGRLVGYLLDRNPRFWRTSALVIICAWSWVIFSELSTIIIEPATTPDRLVVYIIVGIILIVVSGLSTHFLGRRYKESFKEKPEEKETMEETRDINGEQNTSG